jgi:hypothetical protein
MYFGGQQRHKNCCFFSPLGSLVSVFNKACLLCCCFYFFFFSFSVSSCNSCWNSKSYHYEILGNNLLQVTSKYYIFCISVISVLWGTLGVHILSCLINIDFITDILYYWPNIYREVLFRCLEHFVTCSTFSRSY